MRIRTDKKVEKPMNVSSLFFICVIRVNLWLSFFSHLCRGWDFGIFTLSRYRWRF